MAAETFYSEFWLLDAMELGLGRTDIPDMSPNVLWSKHLLKYLSVAQQRIDVSQGDLMQRTTEAEKDGPHYRNSWVGLW